MLPLELISGVSYMYTKLFFLLMKFYSFAQILFLNIFIELFDCLTMFWAIVLCLCV